MLCSKHVDCDGHWRKMFHILQMGV